MSSDVIVFTRDMGLDHAEFFRIVRRALGDPELAGETVVVDMGENRRLIMALDPTRPRSIAGIALPATWVHFRFEGVSAAEAEIAMGNWDRIFQRGGG